MSRLLSVLLVCALTAHAAEPAATPPAAPKVPAKAPPKPVVIPPDLNGHRTIIAAPVQPSPVRVAIFEGTGAPESGIANVCARVEGLTGATLDRLKPEQIAAGALEGYDVVIFSGGSGSAQAKSLGDAGRERVREFVRNGGGYVGICAGAYLACSNFSWGLGILNASTVSSKWMRGSGFVEMEVTVDGKPILGPVDGTFLVRYNNGPILKPGDRADLPAYKPLALFRTEVAKNGTPVGVMVHSPAQAVASFGRGRVFVSSPHPENTPGLEHLIPRGILWAAGKLEEKAVAPAAP